MDTCNKSTRHVQLHLKISGELYIFFLNDSRIPIEFKNFIVKIVILVLCSDCKLYKLFGTQVIMLKIEIDFIVILYIQTHEIRY